MKVFCLEYNLETHDEWESNQKFRPKIFGIIQVFPGGHYFGPSKSALFQVKKNLELKFTRKEKVWLRIADILTRQGKDTKQGIHEFEKLVGEKMWWERIHNDTRPVEDIILILHVIWVTPLTREWTLILVCP